MKPTIIFPVILIILDFCAGLVYLSKGDLKQTIYWWAAATLTATVTF